MVGKRRNLPPGQPVMPPGSAVGDKVSEPVLSRAVLWAQVPPATPGPLERDCEEKPTPPIAVIWNQFSARIAKRRFLLPELLPDGPTSCRTETDRERSVAARTRTIPYAAARAGASQF